MNSPNSRRRNGAQPIRRIYSHKHSYHVLLGFLVLRGRVALYGHRTHPEGERQEQQPHTHAHHTPANHKNKEEDETLNSFVQESGMQDWNAGTSCSPFGGLSLRLLYTGRFLTYKFPPSGRRSGTRCAVSVEQLLFQERITVLDLSLPIHLI